EVVSPGQNTIRLVVEDSSGKIAQDSVTFYAKVPQRDMKITVNWDTDATDMDMHVTDPKGETCMYNHKVTKIGGRLDIDVTDGFGPETFTLANAVKGRYKIHLHYYGPSKGPVTVATVWIVLHEGTPRERREKRELVLKNQGEKPLVWEFEMD
ncbi:MAG: YfaP family protein, partial [Planctomycetota bacterium]